MVAQGGAPFKNINFCQARLGTVFLGERLIIAQAQSLTYGMNAKKFKFVQNIAPRKKDHGHIVLEFFGQTFSVIDDHLHAAAQLRHHEIPVGILFGGATHFAFRGFWREKFLKQKVDDTGQFLRCTIAIRITVGVAVTVGHAVIVGIGIFDLHLTTKLQIQRLGAIRCSAS